MSVSITKKFFYNGTASDILKIVFTSPNIESPAAAGSRSHILPGSEYIGTWYEANDYMYRKQWNQSISTSSGTTYFKKAYVGNTYYNMATDDCLSSGTQFPFLTFSGTNELVLYHKEPIYTSIDGAYGARDIRFYYDKNNYITVADSTIGLSTTTGILDGETYYVTWLQASGTNTYGTGNVTISGSNTTASGSDVLYFWTIDHTSTPEVNPEWANKQQSVVFEVTAGEAYNCRLTAWDDITHTTTNNKILSEGHYKASCLAYNASINSVSGYDFPTKTLTPVAPENVFYYIKDLFVYPPASDLVLKGNESYYGDFDLIHMANGGPSGDVKGNYLLFCPRLDAMDDTFTSGNYDFYTTLHYQYT